MLKKLRKNKGLMVLMFLATFSFSIGLFSNYRELWLLDNGISTISISRTITIANIVTALALLFFSLKVSTKKLKHGILISTLLKMIADTILLCLNGSGLNFPIKFLMFFDIAFTEIILSSVYPLILNIAKSNELYTKRQAIESVSDKIGFFIVSFLLGKTIGHTLIDYNFCLLLSVVFIFISFIILLLVDIEGKESKSVSLKESFTYFNKNKSIYLFLFVSLMASATWASILGLKMLTFTETIGLSSKIASYLILGLGLLTNVLAVLIVKYFKSKNDYINIFFKYGVIIILYLLIVLFNNNTILLITMIYLLITDMTYSFVFSGYFLNNMEEKYILVFSVAEYIVSLIGNGLGVFICGLNFNMGARSIGIATGILGLITYIGSNILVNKKKSLS